MKFSKAIWIPAVVIVPAVLFVDFRPAFNFVLRKASYKLDPDVGIVQHTNTAELSQIVRGKRTLVVGGTTGIGLGIAKTLAASGAHVAVVGRRDFDVEVLRKSFNGGSEDTPEENSSSQIFRAHQHDISTIKGCKRLTSQLRDLSVSESGEPVPFDAVFFTAGVWPNYDENKAFSADGVEKTIAIDLVARHVILKDLYENNMLKKDARIVNTLSSTTIFPGQTKEGILARVQGWNQMATVSNGIMPIAIAADAWLQKAASHYNDDGDKGDSHLKFIGFFPGIIITDLPLTTFPQWVLPIMRLFTTPVAISAEESGLAHVAVCWSDNVTKSPKSAMYFNHLLEGRESHPLSYDSDLSASIWDTLENISEKFA